jgi:hypothetical protein
MQPADTGRGTERRGGRSAVGAMAECACTAVSPPEATQAPASADRRHERRALTGQPVDEGVTGAIVRVDDLTVVQLAVRLPKPGPAS